MRRRLVLRWTLASMVVVLATAAYAALPFLTAWHLREAIKAGDSRTIAAMVEWEPVRESLKASLARHADLLPAANAAGAAVQPTLWQRVKGALGATMLDRFVESYVTPEGLPQLFSYRQTYREYVGGEDPAVEKARPWYERLSRFAARVKRAEFQGWSRLVLEVEDRHTADRRYRSVLERSGLAWKLVHLEVLGVAASAAPAPAAPLPVVPPGVVPATQSMLGAAVHASVMPQPRLADYISAAWSAAKEAARARFSPAS